jgi:hypothetical protein
VGGGAVQIEVVFFDILAVIAFAVGHPEEPLFQYRVPAVPQGQGQAEALFVIGEPGQAVFPPAIGPGAGHIMGKVIPGIARNAVILPHRPPLAFTQVGPPFPPRNLLLPGFLEPPLFLRIRQIWHHQSRLEKIRFRSFTLMTKI